MICNNSNKQYKFVKVKKSNKLIFSLTDEDKLNNCNEEDFKNIFKLKLARWHNLLSGSGTTGDPALDDIINIIVLCYLEDRISDKGIFDLKNLKHYGSVLDKKRIKKNFKYLSLEYWLNNIDEIKPKEGLSAIEKLGEILTLHPLTSRIIKEKEFIKCPKPLIIVKLISEISQFTKLYNIFKYQDLIGIAYEMWVNKYKGLAGKELGTFFTEREVMRMCFELIDKKDLVDLNINNNSTIGDEFCGTFGFPLYLKKFLKRFKVNIKDKNVYGIEYEDRASRFAIINAMFSMSDFRNVDKGDSFRTNISSHLDISVHNVPFGKRMKANIIESEYKRYREDNLDKKLPYFDDIIDIKINKDCILSSQLVMYKTKKMGLCIIKDGEETSGVGKYVKYRQFFCENCRIKKILKIPSGSFSSTGTKTVCIYFVKKKGFSTENIQFLEIDKSNTKINEICNVSIKDLRHNNYSWNPDDYTINEKLQRLISNSVCEFKKLGDFFIFEKKSKRKASYGMEYGKYPFYTSSLNLKKFVNENDYNRPSIIIGDGGCANINYSNEFSVSDHCYVMYNNDPIVTRFTYYYLRFNLDQLEKYYIGSGIRNISKTNLKKVLIPFPSLKSQTGVVKILDDLMNQRELLQRRVDGICRQIKYNFEEELNAKKSKVMKLGELIKINIGSTPSTKKSSYWNNGKHIHISVSELHNNLIPITDSKKKLTDKALEECKPKLVKEGTLLMSFKLSIGKLGIAGCDLYTNEAIVRIDTGNNILNQWLFYYFYTYKPQGATGAIGNGNLNKDKLRKIDIVLLEDDKEIKKVVKNLNELQDRIHLYNKDIQNIDELMFKILKGSFLIKK